MFWKSRASRMRDLNAEMQTHLDMATRDRIARGESPEEAARNARRTFGDQTTVRESTSDMWSGDWPHQVAQEFKQAARSLARVPVFSLAAVLTLALGIGANTAIFSVINGVVLRPLPFAKPDQLVYITSQFPKMNLDHFPLDGAEFIELRERNHSFKEVGAYAVGAVNVGADESPRRVTSAIASASLFTAMGVPPLAGRTFREDETLPNGPTVAVISHDLWQTAFGGRSIVGQQIQVDGISRTVIGIMPSGFDVHDEGVQLWTPLILDPANRNQFRGGHYLTLVGRLKDGISSDARAQRSGDDARAVERPRRRKRQAAVRVLRQRVSFTRRIRWSTASATTTCRVTSSAESAARSGCFRRRWDSCCSSPARISPTCC